MAKSFLEVIRKGNPWHDPKTGRFATGPSGLMATALNYNNVQDFIHGHVKEMLAEGIDNTEAATKLWKDAHYKKDFGAKALSQEDAVDIIRNEVPDNVLSGWFRNADSHYKERLENIALTNDSVRNAALNIAHSNYKDFTGSDIDFNEFLNKEITVYRGSNSNNWVEGDEIVAFSYDRKIAEKFGSNIVETTVKPIDTIGSYQTTAECEILVRRQSVVSLAKSFMGVIQKFNRWHDPKTGRFTFSPDKGYSAGGGGGKTDSNGRGLSSAQAAYFADSKAVDADGNLAVVYHGTVNEFTEFDESYFDPRSDMGAGIYLSNSHSDSESNYGDEQGADLRNKISNMADRLEAEGMDYDEAYAEAEKMFITAEPQTLECYVNMQNPVYITRAPGKNTKFTFDEGYDPELDEYGDPDGTLIELTDRIADAVYSGKYSCWDHDGFVEEVRNKLYQEAMDWGEVDAETVVKVIKDASWNYEITAENRFGDGLMAGSEVARDAFERMGYDGIIDSTVSGKFRGMNNMDNSTTHYIAFNSSQVKLVSNQNPTDSADITKAVIELDIVEGM